MENTYFISRYCHVKNNAISLNGSMVYENEAVDLNTFLKSAYQNFQTDYPKFFKMDGLSKLAFMSSEVLLKSIEMPEEGSNIAIVLSNRASSLDTDRKYQESISDSSNFYPSPAVFVYNLPNICIGEISIRHKLYSENSFFIFDQFNADYLYEYGTSLLDSNKADSVLCGWVDVDKDKYEAFMYLVTKNGSTVHTKEEITRLYQYQ